MTIESANAPAYFARLREELDAAPTEPVVGDVYTMRTRPRGPQDVLTVTAVHRLVPDDMVTVKAMGTDETRTMPVTALMYGGRKIEAARPAPAFPSRVEPTADMIRPDGSHIDNCPCEWCAPADIPQVTYAELVARADRNTRPDVVRECAHCLDTFGSDDVVCLYSPTGAHEADDDTAWCVLPLDVVAEPDALPFNVIDRTAGDYWNAVLDRKAAFVESMAADVIHIDGTVCGGDDCCGEIPWTLTIDTRPAIVRGADAARRAAGTLATRVLDTARSDRGKWAAALTPLAMAAVLAVILAVTGIRAHVDTPATAPAAAPIPLTLAEPGTWTADATLDPSQVEYGPTADDAELDTWPLGEAASLPTVEAAWGAMDAATLTAWDASLTADGWIPVADAVDVDGTAHGPCFALIGDTTYRVCFDGYADES